MAANQRRNLKVLHICLIMQEKFVTVVIIKEVFQCGEETHNISDGNRDLRKNYFFVGDLLK